MCTKSCRNHHNISNMSRDSEARMKSLRYDVFCGDSACGFCVRRVCVDVLFGLCVDFVFDVWVCVGVCSGRALSLYVVGRSECENQTSVSGSTGVRFHSLHNRHAPLAHSHTAEKWCQSRQNQVLEVANQHKNETSNRSHHVKLCSCCVACHLR